MSSKKNIDWSSIFSMPSIIYTLSGIFIAVVALKGFLIPNRFMDGGVTSMSIILYEMFNLDFSYFYVGINLIFVYFGYLRIGKTFAVHSFLAILILGLLSNFITLPIFTEDKILIAFFGGFLIGLGVGLVIRAGAVIDGIEILADYTNKKSGFSTSEIILFINVSIMLVAAFYFGLETAMYSILTYFTAVRTSDYVVDGFEEYTALNIISREHELVKSILVNDYNKAITVYKGERGYLPDSFEISTDCDIVMTIVTRLEIHRLKKAIEEADPTAFFYVSSIKEVSGGVIKKKKKS
ncbi:MAG: YitT family protein [Saprospiraceae bacterium]|jgi:uncharacterized membrane-anchored protein YitT (DUF2179 family)|nr:YitT family protein [Saprospiraceae bacterium]MBP6447871.1 YitT family protein [Saprospiraceae bacterium]